VAGLKQPGQRNVQPWNQMTARRPGPLARLAGSKACRRISISRFLQFDTQWLQKRVKVVHKKSRARSLRSREKKGVKV
jgi:hypothetical protein